MVSNPQSGTSMIEVLIAMSLVSAVAVSVAPLLLLGVQVSAHSQDATDLLLAGSEQMELLRSLSLNDPALTAGGSLTSALSGYSIDPLPGNADHYIRWEVTDLSPHLKKISLVVGSIKPLLGDQSTVLLETFRTDLR